MNGGLQGWLEKSPQPQCVCLLAGLERPPRTFAAHHSSFSLSVGSQLVHWVLACLQACGLWGAAGGVSLLKEPGLQRPHYSGTWEDSLTSVTLGPLIGCL